MIICPHCDRENPKDRILCIHCENVLVKEKKSTKIINSIWGIIAGVLIIIFDTGFDLSLGFFIPIPFALSLVGIAVIMFSIESLIKIFDPKVQLMDDDPVMYEERIGYYKGVPLALLAGTIFGTFWYLISTRTGYHFGVLAIVLGWVIGRFITIGTEIKSKIKLQITSVCITIVALLIVEYSFLRYFLVQYYSEYGYMNIPFFLPIDIIQSLFMDLWRLEPLTIIIWSLSLAVSFATSGGFQIDKQIIKARNAQSKLRGE